MKNKDIQLFLGNCFKFLPTLPERSVDLVLCDLPFGITAHAWDRRLDLDLLWKEYFRLLKKDGTVLLHAKQPYTTDLIISNRKWFRYCWIWDKVRTSGFQLAKKRPLLRHEEIVVFSRKGPRYYPLMELTTKSRKYKTYAGSKTNPLQHCDDKVRKRQSKFPQTILTFLRDAKVFHPNQKPLKLLEYLIKTFTLENEMVLDNTMGGGSTGVACVHTGRRFIGIELEPEYFDIATSRINSAKRTKSKQEKRSLLR